MRPVKNPHLFKQNHSNTTAFSFADFGAHFHKQRLDITPLDVPTCGMSEDQFESAPVFLLHREMVPQ